MSQYPFPHDGPVYLMPGRIYDTLYYSRNKLKYVRYRNVDTEEWADTWEQRISDDEFMMVVACIERRPRRA